MIVIVIISGIFILSFYDHPFSQDSADWNNFASYFNNLFNPFITILNLAILIILTYFAQQINIRVAEQSQQYQIDLKKIDARFEITKKIFNTLQDIQNNFENEKIEELINAHTFLLQYVVYFNGIQQEIQIEYKELDMFLYNVEKNRKIDKDMKIEFFKLNQKFIKNLSKLNAYGRDYSTTRK